MIKPIITYVTLPDIFLLYYYYYYYYFFRFTVVEKRGGGPDSLDPPSGSALDISICIYIYCDSRYNAMYKRCPGTSFSVRRPIYSKPSKFVRTRTPNSHVEVRRPISAHGANYMTSLENATPSKRTSPASHRPPARYNRSLSPYGKTPNVRVQLQESEYAA